jgi:enoyl-CoA hydratase
MVELTLEGPGKNALSTAVLEGLLAQLDAAKGQPLLLTGAGDALSAGVNLKEIATLPPEGIAHFLSLLDQVVRRLYLWPAPTVVAVNGHAIAGGSVIACTFDLRIGTTDPRARIGLNELAIGVRFPPAALAMLRARLPTQHVDRLLLAAELHGPVEALRLGLLDELSDDVLTTARARLAALAAYPREPYARTKEALRGATLDLPASALKVFEDEVVPSWSSPELRERLLRQLKR